MLFTMLRKFSFIPSLLNILSSASAVSVNDDSILLVTEDKILTSLSHFTHIKSISKSCQHFLQYISRIQPLLITFPRKPQVTIISLLNFYKSLQTGISTFFLAPTTLLSTAMRVLKWNSNCSYYCQSVRPFSPNSSHSPTPATPDPWLLLKYTQYAPSLKPLHQACQTQINKV